jgi:peptide/nickel transport system substrate-binding protein
MRRCRRASLVIVCNPKVEELRDKIQVETDKAKRDDMIAQAYRIVHEEAGYIPLHQQSLVWGVSKKVHVVQRPDNQILFYLGILASHHRRC